MIVERYAVVRATLRALRTRRFLILAGLSGTGKTQLARRLAQSIVAADRVSGAGQQGQGSRLVEEALARAEQGESNFLFEPVPGHPEYVRVVDVGSGGAAAKADQQHEKRVGFLPVRPDWTDAKRVFGYYNPLTGRFYPTDAMVVLLNAFREFVERGAEAGSYFLILDEMNLARVEHYFSDILSLMESGCSLDPDEPRRVRLGELARVHPLDTLVVSQGSRGVHDQRSEAEAQAAFTGVDTGGKKVMSAARTGTLEQMVPLRELDERRFVYEPLVKGLEFVTRPTAPLPPIDEKRHALCLLYPIPPRVAFPPNLTIIGTINVDETTYGLSPKVLDRAFVLDFTEVSYGAAFGDRPDFAALEPLLSELHAALAPKGLHFGYRVVSEMLTFIRESGGETDPVTLDFLLMSKVMPKLRGSETQLRDPLNSLFELARRRGLERTIRKVTQMLAQLDDAGHASFF
ncbi:MAG: hypothetical protein IV100_24055 [Myxococcales bacterium]|nr:hypothetical protein [Myxococcales bacterium]